MQINHVIVCWIFTEPPEAMNIFSFYSVKAKLIVLDNGNNISSFLL